MADYVLTREGILETANGRSRVYKGGTVSLTDWEYAHNSHLFVEPEPELAEQDWEEIKQIALEDTLAKHRPADTVSRNTAGKKAKPAPSKQPAARASIKRR